MATKSLKPTKEKTMKGKKDTRDNFSDTTKKELARRAAHFCSAPYCIRLTIGPHSDEQKSLATGCAAHIHAAAENGPRYDPTQTPEQRKDITNGIWMCRECGDEVDKDTSKHTADQLRQWKATHEAMIAETRTKGYAASLLLLQANRATPGIAKRVIDALEDRRALWASFDAEFPDRVRLSLDYLRSGLTKLRGELADGSPLDAMLGSLIKTIHDFFQKVEHLDLARLHCNSKDPNWVFFSDSLRFFRKSIGLLLVDMIDSYSLSTSNDLKSLLPEHPCE